MKLWLKYTLAGMVGIIFGIILQADSSIYGYILGLAEFSLRLGRFIIFPLFFFTLSVSVCQLRRDRVLIKTSLKLLVLALLTVVLQILISMGVSFILPLDRIPIITETSGWQSPYPFRNLIENGSIPETLRKLLPINGFEVFNQSGDFILPALILSFFLGTQLFYDKEEAEPVFNLFDSFSRMLYRMNTFFTKIFVFFIIPVTSILIVQIKGINDFSAYMGLLKIVAISSVLILFVLYPVSYFLITKRKPFSDMGVFSAALVGALFTGDNFINAQILMRTLKENGGMKRKASGLSLPLLTMFSRAGTAMITNICLLTILKSYSSLELTAFQVFWVMGVSILVSLLLFSQSYMGVYSALIISCSLYGRGLIEGYVLILPILPVLIIFACLLDAANIAFIILALGNEKEFRFPEAREDFI
ncbi:MAG: hypothetical protein B6241_08400 [Spirochaetaceae bacterium 4572_59]|nr:MAG: hypothetical protein B6241_08400 [Spirochaetaceae bacterium 4572_59]